MSRAIKAAPCEIQSTGIACPNIIAYTLVNATHIKEYHSGIGVWVITSVNLERIIFKEQHNISSVSSEDIGGHYTYNFNWNTHLISRNVLPEDLQKLFDQVVLNTRHWGKPAQLALKFLAKTLEQPDETP